MHDIVKSRKKQIKVGGGTPNVTRYVETWPVRDPPRGWDGPGEREKSHQNSTFQTL